MNQPLVSVVIPVYNAVKYIRTTIQSVIEQNYSNWEIILVNDGSTDDSLQILMEYRNNDPIRFKVVTKNNSGVSDTRNVGIKMAGGKYIALLDADDFWLPENLNLKIDLLEANPELGFVFSDMYEVDADLKILKIAEQGKDENILQDILLWNGEVIPGPCSNLVIRKSCFDGGIHFKKQLSTIADQNLTVQLAYAFKGKRIPQPLWYYRILSGSMSKSVLLMEKDCLNTYCDYWKNGYFHSKKFQLQCFANMYLILAGSFWKDAGMKLRAMDYLIKSICCNPFILVKMAVKISGGGKK